MTKPYTIPTQGKYEELVEELYTLLYHTDLDGFERIERAITLILSAVRDGLPLPGELSRDVTGDDQLIIIVGASQGIALRKEGTGKEEEGDG